MWFVLSLCYVFRSFSILLFSPGTIGGTHTRGTHQVFSYDLTMKLGLLGVESAFPGCCWEWNRPSQGAAGSGNMVASGSYGLVDES